MRDFHIKQNGEFLDSSLKRADGPIQIGFGTGAGKEIYWLSDDEFLYITPFGTVYIDNVWVPFESLMRVREL